MEKSNSNCVFLHLLNKVMFLSLSVCLLVSGYAETTQPNVAWGNMTEGRTQWILDRIQIQRANSGFFLSLATPGRGMSSPSILPVFGHSYTCTNASKFLRVKVHQSLTPCKALLWICSAAGGQCFIRPITRTDREVKVRYICVCVTVCDLTLNHFPLSSLTYWLSPVLMELNISEYLEDFPSMLAEKQNLDSKEI